MKWSSITTRPAPDIPSRPSGRPRFAIAADPVEDCAMSDLYEAVQRAQRGEMPLPPIAKLLGFKLTAIQPGRATVELDADERHANAVGTLHGGVFCDIADAAMGLAYASTLAPGESFTTLELKINFLKPIWRARLRAEGRMVKTGKTIGLVECDVFDDQQSLVARASSTCMTLRGEAARGR
jgi:uncharacterized protein (TIGR00369 family)